jgi:hypothetical protein
MGFGLITHYLGFFTRLYWRFELVHICCDWFCWVFVCWLLLEYVIRNYIIISTDRSFDKCMKILFTLIIVGVGCLNCNMHIIIIYTISNLLEALWKL